MLTKICSKCGEKKPATTEYFRKAKANKDGLMGQCRDCIKEYEKQYYKENQGHFKQYHEENKEKIKEYQNQWYKENKEEEKERQKQYYKENKEHYKQYRKENKEKIKEYQNQYFKQYYVENKEKLKEYNNQWREENEEKIKEYLKQYRQENKESRRQHWQIYQARKRLLPATLTIKQWQQIKDDFNNECAYCGMTEEEHRKRFNEQLHQEHFIPLLKGGEYTHNNIIPACRSCNSSKQDTDFLEWYPTYEHYDKQRETKILEYINSQKGDEIYGNAI